MKINHNFIESALTAFTNDFRDVFRYVNADLPVYVQNTGDEVFILENQSAQKNAEIYEKVPRVVCDFDGIDVDMGDLTNPNVLGRFNMSAQINDKAYIRTHQAKLRRIPITLTANVQMTTASFLSSLKYIEIMISLYGRDRTFEFMYLDFRNLGTYTHKMSVSTERNMTIGHDSNNRNRVTSFTIDVHLQYPCFDVYGNASSQGQNNLSSLNSSDTDGLSLVNDGNVIKKWEHNIHSLPDGEIITQTIPDDTQP